MLNSKRAAAWFLAGFAAFTLMGFGLPGPQGPVGGGVTVSSPAGNGEEGPIAFSFDLGDGYRADFNAIRSADDTVYVQGRAYFGTPYGYEGPMVLKVGFFEHDGGYIGDGGEFWAVDNYGLALGVYRGITWHANSTQSGFSDVTDELKEIALYSSDSGSTGMGPHILRLAGRAIGAADPGFPWDYSGIGSGSDLQPVYLSLAGIAPMRSSDTLTLRDEGGDPALTVESTGELKHGTVDWYTMSGEKALTDATDVEVFRLSVPQGSGAGGTMALSIYATDGTDFQVHSEKLAWAAVNKAGTITSEVATAATLDADADSTGTLTCTFDITEPTADVIALRINANTSLASTTTFRVRWRVQSDTAGVTPQ